MPIVRRLNRKTGMVEARRVRAPNPIINEMVGGRWSNKQQQDFFGGDLPPNYINRKTAQPPSQHQPDYIAQMLTWRKKKKRKAKKPIVKGKDLFTLKIPGLKR